MLSIGPALSHQLRCRGVADQPLCRVGDGKQDFRAVQKIPSISVGGIQMQLPDHSDPIAHQQVEATFS